MARNITPEHLAELQRDIAKLDTLYIVTQMPFDERGFREAYRAVNVRFMEASHSKWVHYSFARWVVREKDPAEVAPEKTGVQPSAPPAGDKVSSQGKSPLFPNSDFEYGTLDHWHPTGFAMMFALEQYPRSANPGQIVLQDPQRLNKPAIYGKIKAGTRYRVNTRAATRSGDPIAKLFGRERLKGELASDVFTIKEPVIGFQLAGQGAPELVHVSLRFEDGSEQVSTPGSKDAVHTQRDVSAHLGKRAQIVIRDTDPAQVNGIEVSGFYYVN